MQCNWKSDQIQLGINICNYCGRKRQTNIQRNACNAYLRLLKISLLQLFSRLPPSILDDWSWSSGHPPWDFPQRQKRSDSSFVHPWSSFPPPWVWKNSDQPRHTKMLPCGGQVNTLNEKKFNINPYTNFNMYIMFMIYSLRYWRIFAALNGIRLVLTFNRKKENGGPEGP